MYSCIYAYVRVVILTRCFDSVAEWRFDPRQRADSLYAEVCIYDILYDMYMSNVNRILFLTVVSAPLLFSVSLSLSVSLSFSFSLSHSHCALCMQLIQFFIDLPSSKCAFSIHNMIDSGGKAYNKRVGQWYGPNAACHLLKYCFVLCRIYIHILNIQHIIHVHPVMSLFYCKLSFSYLIVPPLLCSGGAWIGGHLVSCVWL